MAKLEVIGKGRKGDADKFIKPLDKIISKTDEILEKLDDDTNKLYYIASLNLLSRPLTLFGKEVKSGSPSEQIRISKEKFYELKNLKYFKKEFDKEDSEGKKIVGLQFIEGELDLMKHGNIIKILHYTEQPYLSKIQTKYTLQKIEQPNIKTQCITKLPSSYLNVKFDRIPSNYQIDIFNYIDRLVKKDPSITQRNVLIEAGPGSGKTWTIEQATKIVARSRKICCFLAFNTHITNEFRPRAPTGVDVNTLNSAGNKSVWKCMQSKRKIKTLNKYNVSKIIDYLYTKNKYSHLTQEEFNKLKSPAKKLVDLSKATLININTTSILELIDKYNVDIDFDNQNVMTDLISICKDVIFINYNIFTNTWENFDFNDQWWLPVVYRGETDKQGNIITRDIIESKQYDVIFVDETQDLNKAQIELCKRMCKPNGSIICVGDRNQSIYGFRGADVNSIPNIIKELNPKIFSLPISYRCPKEHIRLVKEFARNLPDADYTRDFKISVEKLEYATTENSISEAIEGEIIENCNDTKIVSDAIPGDLIISRINAALIQPYLKLIKKSITLSEEKRPRIVLLGKNFGDDLIDTIDKLITRMNKENRDYTIKEFETTLTNWNIEQIEKLKEKNLSTEKVTDIYETLLIFTKEFEDIDTIKSTADIIFSDEEEERKKLGSKITLGTIHKSKGSEVDTKDNNLFIIKSFKGKSILPLEISNTKEWEKTQENNLVYVAYTRGKNKMYFIDVKDEDF